MATNLDRTAGPARSWRADGRAAGRHARRRRVVGRGGAVRWVALIAAAVAVAVVVAGGVGPVRGDEPPPSAAQAAPAQGAGPVASNSARPSGLAWHSGVFSHDAQRTEAFAAARGRPVDVLAVFPTRDSWEAIMQDWWMSPSAVPPGFTGTLAVGVPLFPSDGSMQRAASGADTQRWEELGRLIASRYPDAWIRPGWEFNIPNWPWAATPENVESYKAAFRHAVAGLRRGGPQLRIVFNPNEGRGASLPDATQAYPGDDVVDVIGLDAYDWYPAYTKEGWREHRTKQQGWDFWADFARARGKKFALPEWGVMTGSDASGGDNPAYIEQVLAWMGEHAELMAFETYFEETDDYCRCALSMNPRAAAAYTAALPRAADPARLTAAHAWATDPPTGAVTGSAEQGRAATPTDQAPGAPQSAPQPARTDPRPEGPADPEPVPPTVTAGAQPESLPPEVTRPESVPPAPVQRSPLASSESPASPSDQERYEVGSVGAEPAGPEPPDVPGEADTRTPESVRSPGRGRYGREATARSVAPD